MELTHRQQAEIILTKNFKGCPFHTYILDCKDCIGSSEICEEYTLQQIAAKFILRENLKLL